MRTLVIVVHPDLNQSVINKRWLAALDNKSEQYTVHDLYGAYPDGHLDIKKEQQLIETHDNIILQFPFYWFSSPPLLKQWLDEVLTHGWAYGSGSGDKLKGKRIALAVTAGIDEQDYSAEGRYQYSLEELLRPFETTIKYVKADYRSFYAFYGAEKAPEGATEASIERNLADNAAGYVAFIRALEQ